MRLYERTAGSSKYCEPFRTLSKERSPGRSAGGDEIFHYATGFIYLISLFCFQLLFCLLGITRSHPCSVFFLILSRLLLVWGVLMSSIPALHNAGLNLLILAWSTQELCRYLFYCLRVMDCLPYFVIWLRYVGQYQFCFPVTAQGVHKQLYNIRHNWPNNFSDSHFFDSQLPTAIRSR